jgi:predicted RNA binding protein YcfA (HicA-like mRNA interferase family)
VKSLSGKEFCKVLERNGWARIRIRGSHHLYGRPGTNVQISVPVHANRSLKKGIQKHFMTLAGLSDSDL